MQYTTDFQNVYFHFLEDCVRFVFPNFAACVSPFISTWLRIIVAGTKQLFVAIWHLFLHNETVVFWNFWLFSEKFSSYLPSRGYLFITSTKKLEGEGAGGTKFWPMLLLVVHGLFGEVVFFPWYVKVSYIYVTVLCYTTSSRLVQFTVQL